jgi:ABC-type multidrug transport system fused ATPase/permease subunit
LHGTLFENVSFLDETISRDQVLKSLELVGLSSLVADLPGGLESRIGPSERGLSGGQIQRLGIARALARNPQLVILDEPTSALDVDAERIVADALNVVRSRPDVLVIVIAHRPSTLALCDEIVVLENGRIASAGKLDEVAGESEFLSRTWCSGQNDSDARGRE